MKIQYERELQQIPFNNSSDINFHELINRYKKFTAKLYSFLVTDTTFFLFQKEFLRKDIKTNYNN